MTRRAATWAAAVAAVVLALYVATLRPDVGPWADCRIDVPARALLSGINELTLTTDSVIAREDRGGDPRELALAMQISRWR